MKLLKLIFKNIRWYHGIMIVLILGLTFVQVWCNMTLTDDMQELIEAIYLAHYGLGGTDEIWSAALWMVAWAAFSMLAQAGVAIMAALVSAGMVSSIRRKLNEKITNLSMEDIKRFQTSSLITRVTNDVQMIQNMTVIMMAMVFSAPITLVWGIAKIGDVSWELSYVPAIGITFMVVALAVSMSFVIPKFGKQQKLLDRVNGITRENLNGIRVVRAYNAEEYQNAKFDKANTDLMKVGLFTGRIMNLMNPIMMITMNGITLGIYWLGASLVNSGSVEYSPLVQFVMLATQIMMAFVMILFMLVFAPRALVSAKRIDEVMSCESKIKDPEEESPILDENRGSVEFENVTFGYPDGDAPVIHNVTFKANKGQTIAFIGTTGCGKSTLVQLSARLYDVSFGQVKIDGVNVKNLKQSTLRSLIGYVPQRGVLFSGTVASNIKFGNPELSDEKMKKAAEVSCAAPFISEMDGQYEAKIAQGGTNVSGGQRQRLCIARAIANDPEFLVFDDSFSALDFKTDKQVRENLKNEYPNATKMIVAQRVGTIMDADIIVCLKDGQVVGTGAHRELLDNCDEYREIALSQLSKEELGL
ncbi:MAG: ABC transporter ATP-binding protein [Bacillota bacterium]|nr:ABC transporter ATP-binding protein [Bacillota bacterium]